tara:strand:+ start:678 stop:986 length:309 start_codon:yes stop_codon:yes gene_type:complete
VEELIVLYQDLGLLGSVAVMFLFLVYSMNKRASQQAESLEDLKVENKGQSETLENMEGMIIKLIDRWNKSDETRDRRHEDLLREVGDASEKISYLSGRINSK